MTYGRVPKILLPLNSETWSEETLRTVLLHEEAHVRRGDWIWTQQARGIASFCWFSPGFFLLARALRLTAEEAADDAVIASGMRPSDYARELLAFTPRSGGLDAAVIAMVGRSGLRGRIASILAPRRDRRRATASLGLSIALVFGLLALGLAGVAPRLGHLTVAVPTEAVVTETGKATLPDGTNIFLDSVLDLTMDRVVAWSKYGSDTEFPSGELSTGLSPDGKGSTVFNFHIYAPEPNPGVAFRFPNSIPVVATSVQSRSGSKETIADATTERIDVPESTADLMVGVATGSWRKLRVVPLSRAERHIDPDRDGSVEFELPAEAKGAQWRGTVYSGSTPLPFVDTNAQMEEPDGPHPHVALTVRLATTQRIDRVEIAYRPYRWAVFRDVSVHPGRDALAKARRPRLERSVGWGGRAVSYRVIGTEAKP